MRPIASLALEALLTTLAPPRCAACDARVRWLAVFCPSCASTVVRATRRAGGPHAANDGARPEAGFGYGGGVARALARMKYVSRPDLARPLGDLLWRALQPHAVSLLGAVVVPVPLHPVRLAERGFNQSALLAGRLAGRLGSPFRPRALARTRETRQQASLDRTARIANVAGAFVTRTSHAGLVRGRTVLLIDDVATTGATLSACERALLGAGAAQVARLVLALSPHRVEGPV